MSSCYTFGTMLNNKSKRVLDRPEPIVFNAKNGCTPIRKAKLEQSAANGNPNKTRLSIIEQRRKLPIFPHRNQLISYIQKNETLIILGETGSGKTTQIPQYVYSSRLQENGKIAVTQPRRMAAISVATRVATELESVGGRVGEVVGYRVRFEDVTSKQTTIKFLTDGMLLREAISDRLLMDYNVIILDEVHERTIHTDVLFGIVKEAQSTRKLKKLSPLKVLLMSATMDVDHFSTYFHNCKVIYVEGRTYPVEIFYSKKQHEDYQSASIATFFQIHQTAPPNHDVLIFLTGQEEIETVAHQIRTLAKDPDVDGPQLKVLTLYATQSSAQQMLVFAPTPENMRKVVISTNVAETSVTITGIKYVIDAGMVKMRNYDPRTGLDLLKVKRISQEQAWQRAGRAGRESEGVCYRLYTRFQYDMLEKSTKPEIQRANLNIVALQLLALTIHAGQFDFIDKPPKDAIDNAFEQLKLLGAVENVNAQELTEIGHQMALFPLDPRFSKILLTAEDFGCLEEALSIVAVLSGESIYVNPPSKRNEAQNSRQKFYSGYGDHITLLNIFKEFMNVSSTGKRQWCHEHFMNMRNLLYAREVRSQLSDICNKCNMKMSSCGSDMDQLRKCLIAGLFMNVAELHKDRQYMTIDKRQFVNIHPSSVLHGQQPSYVLYTEVIQTSKCYMRLICTVEREWLEELVPQYLRMHLTTTEA